MKISRINGDNDRVISRFPIVGATYRENTGRAREGRSSTKEGLPKSVHTVDTLTSFHKSSPQLFHSIPQTRQRQKLKDTPSPQRRKPPACLLTVFCEIFIPDRVTDCKSLDTLDAVRGGSSHEHSPPRQRGGLQVKQTMTAQAEIFQERGITGINLLLKLPSEVGG